MGTLPIPRQELMAQNRANGQDIKTAGRNAGYQTPQGAYTFSRTPEFQARVAELLAEKAEQGAVKREEFVRLLSARIRSDIVDAVDENYTPINPYELDAGIRSRITSFKFDKFTGTMTEFKVDSSIKDMELYARVQGWTKDSLALTGATGGPIETVNADMTPEQLAELWALARG